MEGVRTSSVAWMRKTYGEILDIARADGSILLVPVGSIEQHGNHLPVSTDTVLVDAVSHRSAERVENSVPILVTPPVWCGYSPHHLSFGGTLSGTFETLLHLLSDIVETGAANGFDSVLLVNGHGGNTPLIGSAVSKIGVTRSSVEVLGLTYFDLARSFIEEIRDSDLGGMAHGGEFETSLMLHLAPEQVRDDVMDATSWDEPYELGMQDLMASGPLTVYRSFDWYSDSGAIGDPGAASAEKGEVIFDLLVDEMAELLNEIHRRNRDE